MRRPIGLLIALLVIGCIDSAALAAAVPSSDTVRFLNQATFGPTGADLAHTSTIGLSAWITEQESLPATLYSGFTYVPQKAAANCTADATAPTSAASLCHRDNYTLFQVRRQMLQHAVSAKDQLRQRVAYALSQIFVVSGVVIPAAYGMADYQNLLLQDAFANYRTLIEDITLSPVMGRYLDMANNDKANAAKGTTPNENYARELLQLFSIGLVKLSPDGSVMKDAAGAPLPTYDQEVIEEYATLFTGWTYPPLPGATSKFPNPQNFDGRLVAFDNHHDTSAKTLLNGTSVPGGQSASADLKAGLNLIARHPNVGPFLSRQLIQQLVTSNPSAGYVRRVAAVFANDGTGVRGNLGAVVRAVLLDPEARGDQPAAAIEGHLKDPVLYIASLARALSASTDGVGLAAATQAMGEPVYSPPTVFNFIPPSYDLPGTTVNAPEFFLDDDANAIARANVVDRLLRSGWAADASVSGAVGTQINLSALTGSNPAAIVDAAGLLLLHGPVPTATRSLVINAVAAVPSTDPISRARTAAQLIALSGVFQVVH
jgi:uncharacterized protein (DUF1800 family)